MTEEISSGNGKHLIKNDTTGKNSGQMSAWFDPGTLDELLAIAEPGDLLEIDRIAYRHWGIYAGCDMNLNGQHDANIVHFGRNTYSPSVGTDLSHEKSKPTVNYNKLVDVVGKSRVRVNNSTDDTWRQPVTDTALVNERIQHFMITNNPYDFTGRNCEDFAKFCRCGAVNSEQRIAVVIFIIIFSVRNIVDAVQSKGELISASCIVLLVFKIFWFQLIPILIHKFKLVFPTIISPIMISNWISQSRITRTDVEVITDDSSTASSESSLTTMWLVFSRVVPYLPLLSASFIGCYAICWAVVMLVVGVRYITSLVGETYTFFVVGVLVVIYTVGMKNIKIQSQPVNMVLMSCAFLGANILAYVFRHSNALYWSGIVLSSIILLLKEHLSGVILDACIVIVLAAVSVLPAYILVAFLIIGVNLLN